MHGDQIGLDMPDLHDITGSPAVRVVGKEHQDIKGRLRQLQLLTQGLADRIVGLRGLDGKFHVRIHAEFSFHF